MVALGFHANKLTRSGEGWDRIGWDARYFEEARCTTAAGHSPERNEGQRDDRGEVRPKRRGAVLLCLPLLSSMLSRAHDEWAGESGQAGGQRTQLKPGLAVP